MDLNQNNNSNSRQNYSSSNFNNQKPSLITPTPTTQPVSQPTIKKIPLVRSKGMSFLIFYSYLSIILIIILFIGLGLMYKQLRNINHYLSQSQNANLSNQIKLDCQVTALTPQNCH